MSLFIVDSTIPDCDDFDGIIDDVDEQEHASLRVQEGRVVS